MHYRGLTQPDDWDGLYTNLVSATSFPFTDKDTVAAGRRFYRTWHLR